MYILIITGKAVISEKSLGINFEISAKPVKTRCKSSRYIDIYRYTYVCHAKVTKTSYISAYA